MSHTYYIAMSYGVTALISLSLIAWVFFDGRGLKREMSRLEEAGIRRRSSTKK